MTLAHNHHAHTPSDNANPTLATDIADVIARRQGAQSLAGAIIAALPAHLCCIFQVTQHTLEYCGGAEEISSGRVHKPAGKLIARMATLATHAAGDTQIRQHIASYRHAAWPALLTVPLITERKQPAGVLVAGRRDRAFTASEIAAVQAVTPQVATYLSTHAPVQPSQT
ncbi:MAG TPA: GAF domain-containing protein, partial [Ktedonobacterales bacterium]|nr:GAF domain-containing protein [Ktedonobacterales bacterium]